MSSDPNECLEFNSIQSAFRAPLRKHHTTTAAAIKVVNHILHALDKKQFCLSLFRDFSKAFDAVDYSVLPDCLKATGLSTIFLAEPRAAQTVASEIYVTSKREFLKV